MKFTVTAYTTEGREMTFGVVGQDLEDVKEKAWRVARRYAAVVTLLKQETEA